MNEKYGSLEEQRRLKLREVLDLFGISRSTLHVWLSKELFPRPVKTGNSNRWIEREVREYMSRQEKRRG